jgi:ribose transport system ATP-binding protein
MGRLPANRLGFVDWSRLVADTDELSRRLGLMLEAKVPVGRLSVARRQMVEIAKALSRDARIIVLDEPSAVLGDAELEGLFDVIHRLAAKGTAFIYISHRLNEVFKITDRVTVMKDGRVVMTRPTGELTPAALVRAMVGREVLADVERPPTAPGADALNVRGLTRRGVIDEIDLGVRVGEIVGIAGLAGSGRTEVLRAIFGADPVDAGEISVFGQPARIRRPRDAVALGIGLLTEDRKADGLLMLQSLAFNVTITQLADVSSRKLLSRDKERRAVHRYVDRLDIRTPGAAALVRNLSGGNQQKAIFAKWLHARCRILLIDEPTRGVDVGAKHEIHALLAALAAGGVAIVMVSSELPEILAVSDSIIVMREGRITARLTRSEATEERIMHHATHDEAGHDDD